jgi:hypothetical protein
VLTLTQNFLKPRLRYPNITSSCNPNLKETLPSTIRSQRQYLDHKITILSKAAPAVKGNSCTYECTLVHLHFAGTSRQSRHPYLDPKPYRRHFTQSVWNFDHWASDSFQSTMGDIFIGGSWLTICSQDYLSGTSHLQVNVPYRRTNQICGRSYLEGFNKLKLKLYGLPTSTQVNSYIVNMFTQLVKPAAFKPIGLYSLTRIARQVRTLATIEGSAGRTMPVTRPRATPVSHDRATFTIRVRLKSIIEACG